MRRLLLSCIIGLAYFFTISSLVSCNFWESQNEGGGMSAAGLFSFSYRHAICISYKEIHKTQWGSHFKLEPATKFAQVLGIFAGILGGMACLLTVFGSCLLSFFVLTKKTWRILLASCLWGAMLCQTLTYTTMIQVNKWERCGDEDVECALGIGGLFGMFAAMLYFLAATILSALALQPPRDNPGTTYLARLGSRLMQQRGISWKRYPIWRWYTCSHRDSAAGNNYHLPRWQDISLLILAILLLHSSFMIVLDCRFYQIEYYGGHKTYYEGIFRYYYPPDSQCKNFELGSLESFTAQTTASNVFAVLTVLISCGMTALLGAMVLVINFPKRTYKSLPILSMMAAFCQSLTFLGLSERKDTLCAEDLVDQECSLGPDGFLCLINTIVYFYFVAPLFWYSNNPNIDRPTPPTTTTTSDKAQIEDDDDNGNKQGKGEEEEQAAEEESPHPSTATTTKSLDAGAAGAAASNIDGATTTTTTDMLLQLPPPEIDTEMGVGDSNYESTNENNKNNNIKSPQPPLVVPKMKSIMTGEGTKMD